MKNVSGDWSNLSWESLPRGPCSGLGTSRHGFVRIESQIVSTVDFKLFINIERTDYFRSVREPLSMNLQLLN